MNSLSKLQKLQLIEIRCPEDEDVEDYDLLLTTDLGLIDVINNYPEINSINQVFKVRPNISHKTIDTFIALALRKPLIQFNHYFYGYYTSAEDMVFNVFDSKDFQLPNNLVIN
jgi:hypothetical protein